MFSFTLDDPIGLPNGVHSWNPSTVNLFMSTYFKFYHNMSFRVGLHC